MSLIQVRNLRKSFDQGLFQKPVEILRDLTFSVDEKIITGFIGANGSGKTTTLKCLLDFVRADSGTIEFFNSAELNNEIKSKIGFLPERPYLQEFLTGTEFRIETAPVYHLYVWDHVSNTSELVSRDVANAIARSLNSMHLNCGKFSQNIRRFF